MPTIVDMRPSTNTFRHATLIVIWLVCLVGLGGCKSNLVKETCTDRPVWTTVVAINDYCSHCICGCINSYVTNYMGL